MSLNAGCDILLNETFSSRSFQLSGVRYYVKKSFSTRWCALCKAKSLQGKSRLILALTLQKMYVIMWSTRAPDVITSALIAPELNQTIAINDDIAAEYQSSGLVSCGKCSRMCLESTFLSVLLMRSDCTLNFESDCNLDWLYIRRALTLWCSLFQVKLCRTFTHLRISLLLEVQIKAHLPFLSATTRGGVILVDYTSSPTITEVKQSCVWLVLDGLLKINISVE